MTETKWCPYCQTTKPLTEFGRQSAANGGRPLSRCKACALVLRRQTSPLYTERTPRADRGRPAEPDGQKWCTQCHQLLPFDSFWKEARGRHGLAARCKSCERPSNRAKMRRLRAEDPERYARAAKAAGLAKRYGVTVEWLESRIEAQGGRCPTCAVEYVLLPSKNPAEPVVDHDHQTGQTRDVLCRLCNMALGSARDSATTLRSLASYVERFASSA